MIHLFVSGTSTGIGKTTVSRALLLASRANGDRPLGLKPIETGPDASDAKALATAGGAVPLTEQGFYRNDAPLSPHAIELRGGARAPTPSELARAIKRSIAPHNDVVIAEGAGGLLVPLSRAHTMADVIRDVGWPVALVAANRLGVLSDLLCTYEAAVRRQLDVRLLILNRFASDPNDLSPAENAAVLRQHIAVPVLEFAPSNLDDTSLRRAGAPLLDKLRASLRTDCPSL